MGGRLGVCLAKPITDKLNAEGSGNGLRFGASAMQGWRVHMEDAHVALASLGALDPSLAEWGFFGVFDGHAGGGASRHCAEHLLPAVLETREWAEGRVEQALVSGFLLADRRLREMATAAASAESVRGGTTAVCALVSPDSVYLANCGDSRALLCREGAPAFVTRDHKPERPDEKARIRKAGGAVLYGRLNGTLAVSRALGDFDYKCERELSQSEQLVSPEPEIIRWSRDPDRDQFLVLACDGVWDVMRDDEVCAYVERLMRVTDDLVEIADRLVDACLAKESDDNMSAVIVAFPAAPKPTPEGRSADLLLEETIRRRIADMVNGGERLKKSVYKQLQLIPDLPPGAGIHDKWALIQSTMEELGLRSDDELISEQN